MCQIENADLEVISADAGIRRYPERMTVPDAGMVVAYLHGQAGG